MAQYSYDPVTGQPQEVKIPGQGLIQQGLGFVQKMSGDPFMGVSNLRFVQTPDWIECICPCWCEKANTYQMSSMDKDGLVEIAQFGYVNEEAKCFTKWLCQCWRPWTMKFNNLQNEEIFSAKRDYKIPASFCCPCARPEVVVTAKDQLIGYVRQPYLCCGRSPCPCPLVEEIDICDDQGNVRYFVTAQCCQAGWICRNMLCPRCCGPCQFIRFSILTPTKEKVGEIINVYNGCCQESYTKADRYLINFPSSADYRDKMLLSVAAITIDFDHFERTCGNLP